MIEKSSGFGRDCFVLQRKFIVAVKCGRKITGTSTVSHITASRHSITNYKIKLASNRQRQIFLRRIYMVEQFLNCLYLNEHDFVIFNILLQYIPKCVKCVCWYYFELIYYSSLFVKEMPHIDFSFKCCKYK